MNSIKEFSEERLLIEWKKRLKLMFEASPKNVPEVSGLPDDEYYFNLGVSHVINSCMSVVKSEREVFLKCIEKMKNEKQGK